MTQPERQSIQGENGSPRFPETLNVGNLIWARPADLMLDNPAALIVNAESYNRIGASRFEIDLFAFPQVARVKVYNSEGDEHIKLFVIDGNTRTKYAADHPDQILDVFKNDSIPVRDVTAAQLRSPIVVFENERQEGQTALSMVQYLRAVIPPTIEHAQIAPDRIASYLINGWANTVGEDLAARFSAIAALSILRDPQVPIATDALLRQFLIRQGEIMADETPEERERIQRGILEMASIIRQTKIPNMQRSIAESAFVLVASQSEIIGGEKEALKQVYGLLHMPSVDRKLGDEVATRELRRQEIGILLAESSRKFIGTQNAEQILNTLNQALRDPNLQFEKVCEVLLSTNPLETYHSISEAANVSKLEKAYLQVQRKEEISEMEAIIISNLGKKPFLVDRDIPNLIRVIDSAFSTLNQLAGSRTSITQNREQLQNSGVSMQSIADALISFDRAEEQIKSTTTSQALTGRVNETKATLSEIEKKITREIAIHRAGQVADDVYGDRVQNGHGSLIRSRFIAYLVTEFEKIDNSNEFVVRERMIQLADLDNDLQTKVLTNEIRIQAALRMQEERRRSTSRSAPPAAPIESPPTFAGGVEAGPTEEELDQTRQEREQRRIRLNNERLEEVMHSFIVGVESIDLDRSEIYSNVMEEVLKVHNVTGRIGFNHPDASRVMEDYPRRLEEIQRLRSQLHQRDEDDTSRDTRTRI